MVIFQPRSGLISITVGETRGMKRLEPTARRGLNIKHIQPLSGLMTIASNLPGVSPAVIEIGPIKGIG